MFEVYNPEKGQFYKVYDVKEETLSKLDRGFTSHHNVIYFLVYKEEKWIYDESDNYLEVPQL